MLVSQGSSDRWWVLHQIWLWFGCKLITNSLSNNAEITGMLETPSLIFAEKRGSLGSGEGLLLLSLELLS